MANSTLKDHSEKNGKNTMRTLNIPAGPRENTVQSILGYSRALRVENSKTLGPIQTVLN